LAAWHGAFQPITPPINGLLQSMVVMSHGMPDNQSINQSICGGGDLGGQCASNSQIHNFINPNNHFERYRPLQAVNSAQRLLLCLNFQFNLAAPRARLRAR
jgi:hypothetical protein